MKIVRFLRSIIVRLVCTVVFFSLAPFQVQAQAVDYRLDVNRDFGYGNGSDVRGNFSMTIYGPQETIRTVIYLMDGQEIAQVSEAPFRFRFTTGDYPDGWHELAAIVETTDNRSVTTPVVRLNFVSSAQQADSMKRIFGFVIAMMVVLGGIGIATQFLSLRGGKKTALGAPRNYGVLGGTICPRCSRPYSIHVWSINLIGGRFDRCEHCGKWAFVRRHHPDILAAAEKAELQAGLVDENSLPGTEEEREDEKLRRLLDESKYSKF